MKIPYHRHSLGIAIIFVGIPLAWLLRDFLKLPAQNQSLTILLLVIGLTLMIEPRKTLESVLKFLFFPLSKFSYRFAPLLFLIPSTFAAAAMSPIDIQGLLFFLFTLIFFVTLHTIPFTRLTLIPYYFVAVGGLTSLLVLMNQISSGTELFGQRIRIGETNSPGQLGFMGIMTVVSGIFILIYRKNEVGLLFKLVIYAAIPSGIFLWVLSTSRSTIINFALCTIFTTFYLSIKSSKIRKGQARISTIQKKSFTTKLFSILSKGVIFLMILFILESRAPNLSSVTDLVTTYANSIVSGVEKGYASFKGDDDEEESAATRKMNRDIALENLHPLGSGYKTLWLDLPVLEAVQDGGILGGGIFVIVTLVIPWIYIFTICVTNPTISSTKLFCVYAYIYDSPTILIHGRPYDFYIWLRIILLYYSMRQSNIEHFYSSKNRSIKIG